MKHFVRIAGMLFWLAGSALSQSREAEPLKLSPLHTSITVPAGTHVLMCLTSPLHTTSARAGSGVYLETSWPVVQNDQVVIPAHSRVVGQVEQERRPGRVKGRAQFRLHFTSLILPDNRVMAIAGGLQSLPGDEKVRTKNKEGTIEPVDQIDKDVHRVAGGAIAGDWEERSRERPRAPASDSPSEEGWVWRNHFSPEATRFTCRSERKSKWCSRSR